jgi:RNase P/RNase MRP subunit p30
MRCPFEKIQGRRVKIFPMRVLRIKDEKRAKKLSERFLKKGYIVAVVDREEEVKKELAKKADIVFVVK